jgi:hypothetical protein
MQSFQTETQWEGMDGGLETDLALEGDRVHGTITNRLGHSLEDVIFLFGSRFARLGDVEAGEDVAVDAGLEGGGAGAPFPWALFEQVHQGAGGLSPESRLRQPVLEAFFHTNWGPPPAPSSPMLLAWTDLNPLEVEVSHVRASHENTTLLVYYMPLPAAEGHVELPPGVLTGRGLEFEREAGECGPSGQVYLSHGQATLEYALPTSVRGLQTSRLTLQVTTDGAWNEVPQVALYDWRENEWVEVDSIELDAVQVISDPARFVDRVDGGIRIQVSREGGNGGCYQVNIGLEGELETGIGEVSGE